MKRLIADIHMHTLASGHAYGTIREDGSGRKGTTAAAHRHQ